MRIAAMASAILATIPQLAAGTSVPPPADPLTASIQTEDVERVASVFAMSKGHPTAEQLQSGYIAPGSYGVTVFTPDRIMDADHLASAVAHDPSGYKTAIRTCLPRLAAAEPALRAIYLALHGLLPDEPLPQIYVVMGTDNSGGTAGRGAQVLGLEVLCKQSPDAESFRTTLRRFFAHETVHTFQHEPADGDRSPLLAEALIKGGADFIAALVTGQMTERARAAWATPREGELWRRFREDMVATKPDAASDRPPPQTPRFIDGWRTMRPRPPTGRSSSAIGSA